MSPSATHIDERPSEYIEKAVVLLLGLSFGEHDDGVQRTAISRRLGEIIHLWACGLLAADFPAEEVENTFSAFYKLIQADEVPELINWDVISISDVDQLIHVHWVRAARNMIDLPLPPAKPLEVAIDSLTVALRLLDCIAAKNNRRSAAANTAPGHLVFAALRLVKSTEHKQHQHSSEIRAVCNQSISHLCRMRRSEGKSHLLSSLLSHVLPLIRLAISIDLSSFRAPYTIHDTAPASHVLHSLLYEADENRLIETVKEILPILRELVESVQESIRVQSLHSLSLLSTRLPVSMMEPAPTSKSLQAALSWGDVPTSMIAVPLLATFLPKTKPIDSRGEEYITCASKMIETVVRHMQARGEHSESHPEGLPKLNDAKAAVELSTFVPSILRDLMVCHIDWILALSTFLEQMPHLVRSRVLTMSDFIQTLSVLQESIKWAWLRVDSFRKEVFQCCISLLMETKEIPDAFMIQAAIRNVILLVGKCGQVERLIEMTQEVSTCAMGHHSLAMATDFCKEIEDTISFEDDRSKNSSIKAGPLVSRFFPELI